MDVKSGFALAPLPYECDHRLPGGVGNLLQFDLPSLPPPSPRARAGRGRSGRGTFRVALADLEGAERDSAVLIEHVVGVTARGHDALDPFRLAAEIPHGLGFQRAAVGRKR